MSTQAYIRAISYYLPPDVLDNETLAQQFTGWTAQNIEDKTGIAKRRVVQKDVLASDLAVHSAHKLFKEHKVERSEIDFLLFCAQEYDYFTPTTACMLQQKLQLGQHIGALDYNLGCSGFIYGLSLAKGLIVSKIATNVLLLTSSTLTRMLHPKDKATRTIFGDGAAATLISASNNQIGIGEFVLGTKGTDDIILKNRWARHPSGNMQPYQDRSGSFRSDEHLFMRGTNIFVFVLKTVPKMIQKVLAKAQLNLTDIDLFVFHQANGYMLEALRKKLGIPKEKFVVHLKNCGNTVSASIPIALSMAMKTGQARRGAKILLAGFGVGLSWGATIVTL